MIKWKTADFMQRQTLENLIHDDLKVLSVSFYHTISSEDLPFLWRTFAEIELNFNYLPTPTRCLWP